MKEKDETRLRQMIQEELKAALYRTITIQKGPEKQGDPEKVIKEEEWNVLDFFCVYLPKIEAALRGMQEDIDHTKNNLAANNGAMKVIGETLIAMEKSAKKLAQLSDAAAEWSQSIGRIQEGRFTPLEILTKQPTDKEQPATG